MLVDSHCHLDFPDFAEDLDGIVARAETAGIGRMVTISTRVRRLPGLLEIAERFPNVYCSVGTHPHHADEEDGIPASELIELTRHPKVVALGEAGLDKFYDNGSPEAQERGFRAHIAAARATGLPLVIHTREADEACGRILEDEMTKGPFRAVLHCYTGGRELAMKAISLGLSISFTGILTFKKSEALRELAAELPRPHQVEADAPISRRKVPRQAQRAFLRGRSRQGAGGNAASGSKRSPPTTETSSPVRQSPATKLRHDADLTVLGCGSPPASASALGWGACDPSNPKTAPSLFAAGRAGIEGGITDRVDTAPDLRERLIDANVDRIDAVFLTHEHADQTTASTICVRRCTSAAHSGLSQPIDRRPSCCGFLLLQTPPGSEYPPILDQHWIEAGESRTVEGRAVQ
jgi:TatD DNase family protein